MRILAIDLGTARTGIALCDKLGVLASPYCVLETAGEKKLAAEILEIAEKEQAEKILLGKPVRTDGKVSEMQQKAEAFAEFLQKRTALPVELFNEAYTTVLATQKLHEAEISSKEQKKNIDSAAAAVLLQSYLDSSLAEQ